MHFAKLRLTGFKSFVDATELHIQPGLTGVIGPNGCGKSNLLEALRWVMGETSAKSMRGAGMDDVIFAGAATRQARNYAEVVLTIDNKERRAPAAFNVADEIEIARRITRNMGTNYRHNGKEIRARDAQTLFADAATGANSPALVRQGQISELINSKPKARRRILEDAAGVAGLHARRHEALLRLNSAETNLERVVEVLAQLEAREATLAREADRAERYRVLSEALRTAEAMLLFRRWREAERESVSAREAMEQTGQTAAEATRIAAEAARQRLELEEQTPKLREEDAIARAIHQKLALERQTLDTKESEALAAADRLERQVRQLQDDMTRETAIDADAGEVLEKLRAEYEALAAITTDTAALDAARAAEAAADDASRAADETLETLTADAAKAEAERAALRRQLEDAEQSHTRLEADLAALQSERDAVEADAETQFATAEEAALAVETAEEAIAAADETARAAEETRERAQRDAQSADDALGSARAIEAALRAEIDQLRRALADERSDAAPLIDRLIVTPGAEAALGAALGDDLHAGEAGPDGWGWLELPPLHDAPSLPQGVDSLSRYVEAPPALDRRLSQTGLVSREDGPALQPYLASGQRLVSPEGDLWRWDGLAIAADSAPPAAALRLRQQNRLDAAQTELTEAEEALEGAAEVHAEARETLTTASEADLEARNARRRAEQDAAAAIRTATETDGAVNALKAKIATLTERLQTRESDLAHAQATRDGATETLAQLEDAETARAAADIARSKAGETRAELIRLRSAREAMEAQTEQRTARMDALVREQQDWSQRLENAGAQRRRLEERIEEATAQLEEARLAPEQIAERRSELAARVEDAEARRTNAVDALAAAEAALRDATKVEKEAEGRLSEAREGRARLEARAEAANERSQELTAQLQDHAGCPPDTFLETFELDPEALPLVKDLERTIVRHRQDRDKLGAVNLRADQELQEVRAEREQLSSEQEELDAAIAKLRQGVNALNKEGRERILAAFDEVNRNFSALFTHLFDGGNARLELTESDDPLDAGLEIKCQPPGKRLDSMSLLSGGEQTLAAISLIFAVFMVNPAPICVLDEVDAPLDDANVARFCNLLDEMTRRAQTRFLIITHHAVTMSRMDRLFGVTMVEKGVSQLVSVDLDTAVEMVDA